MIARESRAGHEIGWESGVELPRLAIMALDPKNFEKLGAFYLGRVIDAAAPAADAAPLLYDSQDLVTHAVCVGMTGSGKTGLCVDLLEEAAIDGVPAIVIDPKGDLTNLALLFPKLAPEDFRPWVSEDAARKQDVSIDEFAARQAALWKEGLEKWGQDGARIQRLLDAAEVTIFTPGSTAGVQVSVIASFDAPDARVLDDAEMLGDRIESTATSLLGLIGVNADPATSREFTLVAAILKQAWVAGESLTIVELARRIQKPPFDSVGVLDIETFFPAKERFALVLALNNLLASPGFAVWQQGMPLDIQGLLYTPAGKPRLAVLSIAHLNDAERMFFVSMLLNAAVSWMRAQQGTTSLRALLYMDEVFGFFPPVANPPSKKPLLTLLKQARACGLGVVLATQNPADLDYKGLSNAGTWFIGRLQTERDKLRLLDGLSSASGGVDRQAVEKLLSGLGKRVFLMNNVHEPAPVTFESRWALSYLCGPLTRDQIRALTPATGKPAPAPGAGIAEIPAPKKSAGPPVVDKVTQVFAKASLGPAGRYQPVLLFAAAVRYRDAKLGIDESRDEAFTLPFPTGLGGIDWGAAEPCGLDDFIKEAPHAGAFDDPPSVALRAGSYPDWSREFGDWILTSRRLKLLSLPAMKLVSAPGEDERDFRIRAAQKGREWRDAKIADLRAKYAKKQEALQTKIARTQEAVQREEAQAGQAKIQTMMSIGSTILGAFLGRKTMSASTLGRATTAARGVGRSMKEAGDAGHAREKLAALQAEQSELSAALEEEITALGAERDELTGALETFDVPPMKTGTRIRAAALAWLPA